MLRVISLWCPFEGIAFQLEDRSELFIRDSLVPAGRVINNRVPDLRQSTRIWMPNPDTAKDASRLQVKIEARSVDILRPFMTKMDTNIRLVRRLVSINPLDAL